jgi:hypothetical protein
MATIVGTVTSGGFNRTKTSTIPDGEAVRMLTQLKARYATTENPTPTNAQAIDAWWAELMSLTKTWCEQQEKETARKVSVDSIAPISIVIT